MSGRGHSSWEYQPLLRSAHGGFYVKIRANFPVRNHPLKEFTQNFAFPDDGGADPSLRAANDVGRSFYVAGAPLWMTGALEETEPLRASTANGNVLWL